MQAQLWYYNESKMAGQEIGSFGRHIDAYNAEVIGICRGLDAAVTSPIT